MIIKPPERRDGGNQHAGTSEASTSGGKGHAKSKTTINGKELTAEYNVTFCPDGELATESFELGGKNQSFDKGRVFLVDLSTDPISILPRDVKLPATLPPDLHNPKAWESLAESTLKELEQNPAIGEFTHALR
jgi:hypothetical protein